MTDGLRGLQDLTRMLLDAELSELRQLSEDARLKRQELDRLGAALAARSEALRGGDPFDDFAYRTGQDARWQAWTAGARAELNREAAAIAARREAQRKKAQRAFGRVEALAGIRRLEAEERRLREARRLHADPDGSGISD